MLAGESLPRSRAHLVCIAFETVKVGTPLALGITALAYGS
ncbi:hypothetical protein GCM10010341_38610 [Streptomyces noursei]|nr:hypothetical protein GCM10010341_38610 [Streptomyces noursei]